MLRMTEDHVIPELNKVVYNSIFLYCVIYALVELSFASCLGILIIQLLVNRLSGCRHEANLSKPLFFISQNTFIMANLRRFNILKS